MLRRDDQLAAELHPSHGTGNRAYPSRLSVTGPALFFIRVSLFGATSIFFRMGKQSAD